MCSTFNEERAIAIEWFNPTLNTKMWKQFIVKGNTMFLEMLPKLVKILQ